MDGNTSKIWASWFLDLVSKYARYTRESKNYRCKLVGYEVNGITQEIYLHVMITGVKNSIVKFSAQELVTNDDMLHEFSQTDVRAITFYAFQQIRNEQHSISSEFFIVAQEFINGKTIFVIKDQNEQFEIRKTAQELCENKELLAKFDHINLMIISNTAAQEQAIEDMELIYS